MPIELSNLESFEEYVRKTSEIITSRGEEMFEALVSKVGGSSFKQ
ncbi:hypothetical protein VL4N_13730 [Vagococcus lutrae]|nr:hypothetical protein VL2N_13570 [Vagococcus lutrae]GEQ63932.1 hypothetical protein VL3N_13740 [Vagococcus lutrae]GEQ65823.1 hypothetical protein VL4N_13730 [Vagococcus lutrae]